MVLIGDGLGIDEDLAQAAVLACAQALLALHGTQADLAFVFVSGGRPDQQASALALSAQLLGARTTVGCNATGVIGGGQAVEGAGAVAVWVAHLPRVRVRAFHLEVLRTPESVAVLGVPPRADDVVGILLADPWSFPLDGFIAHASEAMGHVPLVGGLASGAEQRGETLLLLDRRVHERGAVGLLLGGDLAVRTAVSQGCRPIGPPMTVTRAEGSVLYELAGRPALERAREVVESLPPGEQDQALSGLQLGIALDEYATSQGSGDFLVRGLADPGAEDGSLSVGDVVEVGRTVRFHLRDAAGADEDLHRVLAACAAGSATHPIAGVLLFSDTGRGESMFADPSHDGDLTRAALRTEGVAGFFAAGELGPVGGTNYLHGYSASLLAFQAHATRAGWAEVVRPQEEQPVTADTLDAELRDLTGGD